MVQYIVDNVRVPLLGIEPVNSSAHCRIIGRSYFCLDTHYTNITTRNYTNQRFFEVTTTPSFAASYKAKVSILSSGNATNYSGNEKH